MTRASAETPIGPGAAGLLLFAIALLAFGVRAAGFEWVLPDPATVVFAPGDAQYHVRRALVSFHAFPTALLFDAYINFPGGAPVAWPPLWDWLLGAAGLLLVREESDFLRVVAWAPPVVGALTVLPTYFLARRLASRAVGLGAAAIFAVLPMSITFSRVGNPDHHAAVALIGACWLLACVKLAEPEADERPVVAVATVGLCRLALMLTWHGSLLYLGVAESLLFLLAAVTGRRRLYAIHSASALATLAFLAPAVWWFPEPLGGPWSAICLSRLHVSAVFVVACVAFVLFALEAPRTGRPSRGPLERLLWTLGAGVAVVLGLLALPGVLEGLEPGLRFLTLSDGVGPRTGEQLPLFPLLGRTPGRPAADSWGWFAYVLPLVPFALLLGARPRGRPAAWLAAGWCLAFAGLAIVQRRYGNDAAPVVSAGLALGLAAGLGALLPGRPRVTGALAGGVAIVALAPAWQGSLVPKLRASAAALLSAQGDARDRALGTPAGSLTRFLEQVRAVTPTTEGFLVGDVSPAYGIVAHANLGHAIQNVARRPTPTDPFWAFIGRENWNTAFGLLWAQSEGKAVALARQLQARYVITLESADPKGFEGWLHATDGSWSRGRPAATRFRLVADGPRGGRPLATVFRRGGADEGPSVPYKLFERVAGAVFEVRTAPGAAVLASVDLETPAGRQLVWHATAHADDQGLARLRVPYASEPAGPGRVQPRSLWRVESEGGVHELRVSEDAVRQGRVLPVTLEDAAG